MSAVRRTLVAVVPPLLVLAVVLVAAECVIAHYRIPRYLVPKPSDVLYALLGRPTDPASVVPSFSAELIGSWRSSLLKTAAETGCGFIASAIVGMLLAIALSTSRWIERAVYPYTVFFQTVPVVAIAPLLTIWCGNGLLAVSICAFIVSVFPVIANTLAGISSTDPALVDLFWLYGAGRWTRLMKLRLPSALPNILTGLKISAGLAVIGAIVGEFVAGQIEENEPLGIRIVESRNMGNTDRVFAAILLASLLGLAMLWIVQLAGWVLLRHWRGRGELE